MPSKLEQLRSMTTVVADTGDMDSIRAFQPTDCTTNPTLILKAAQMPAYEHIVEEAIVWGRSHNAVTSQVTDRLAVNFGAELTRIVPGRVSTEVDADLSFDAQAMIDKAHASEEKIMTLALDAGALDVADAGDHWQVLTEAHDFIKVRQALEAAKMPMESAVLTMIPTSTVTVTGEGARELLELIETLEDYEDVQKVHANFEIPDSEMKLLG